MNLLDLMVKIGVDDKASSQMEGVSSGMIAKATAMGNAIYDITKTAISKGYETVSGLVSGAIKGYGQYEQLIGGVDKLYGDASEKIQQYAQQAVRTSGMSANQYMETATSFSAALINSLGNDYDKAADMTDVAMRAIADNVDTFGSDMESVMNAYQGFAKENYTMLDNLKLGYAGTKQGAQDLIAAAAQMTDSQSELGLTVDANSLSFGNLVAAISVVQHNMGIAGTTADEAVRTIEGSLRMMSNSWQNFLVAVGSGDEEQIRNSVDGMVTALFGELNDQTGEMEGGIIRNVLPVVKNVFHAVAQVLPDYAKDIVASVVTFLSQEFGVSEDELYEAFGVIADTLGEFVDGAGEFLGTLWENAKEIAGTIAEIVGPHVGTIKTAISTVVSFLGKLVTWVSNALTAIAPFVPAILAAVGAFKAMSVINGVISMVGGLIAAVSAVGGPIAAVVGMLGGWPAIIIAVIAAIATFIATNENARKVIATVWEGIKGAFSKAVEFIKGLGGAWTGIKNTITNAVTGIRNGISNALSGAKNAFTNLVNGARTGVTNTINFVKSIPTRIRSILGNLGKLLYNAGRNILTGLKNGMVAAWNGMTGWIGGLAGKIARLKGPLDYDATVLVKNGMALMDGLYNGLAEGFGSEVVPYVSTLAGKIGDTMGDSLSVDGLDVEGVSASGTYAPVTVNVSELVVREEADVQRVAEELGRLVSRRSAGSLVYA